MFEWPPSIKFNRAMHVYSRSLHFKTYVILVLFYYVKLFSNEFFRIVAHVYIQRNDQLSLINNLRSPLQDNYCWINFANLVP